MMEMCCGRASEELRAPETFRSGPPPAKLSGLGRKRSCLARRRKREWGYASKRWRGTQ